MVMLITRGPDVVWIDLADLPHPERLHIEVRRLPRIRGADANMTQFTGHRTPPCPSTRRQRRRLSKP
jgi:hypothetical protein